MNVRLEAIKFNHDRESATSDALNIRRNETQPVTVPEWRQGVSVTPEDSPAAYAIRETRGNILTIKAKFKSENSANAKVWVRAVEARPQHRQALGYNPIGALLRTFSLDRPPQVGNVLGEAKQRQIEFNAAGETGYETFELHNVRLWRAGVSVSNTEWRWQFRAKPSDHWTDFALTRHRIYTVLGIPGCPWEQTPHDDCNTQLPWADALEYACDWAAGAHDVDDAASMVTQNVYDLGLGRVKYALSSFYSCPNFNCTAFLELLAGGTCAAPRMNCSDCATVVSSFANLVGCNLRQLSLGPSDFHTNTIRLIGSPQEEPDEFFGHEVAWKGSVTDDGRVFDACFQVDGDGQPDTPPFDPLLPANIRFGNVRQKQYRFRLSPEVVLLPDTLTCRKIGYSVPGDCRRLDHTLLEFLKVHYDFAAWRDLAPGKPFLSTADGFWGQLSLSQWRLGLPVQQPKFVGVVEAVQSLWLSHEDSGVLLRLDAFELKTWQEAREFMLRELGEFHQFCVHRETNPYFGDVCFVEACHALVLFARAQFVVLVRSAGRTQISVIQNAMQVDTHLLNLV